jgi:hypothetical protein
MLARLTSAAAALVFASTAAEAAPLAVSNDPTLAYTILAVAAGIVVVLAIGAYSMEHRRH